MQGCNFSVKLQAIWTSKDWPGLIQNSANKWQVHVCKTCQVQARCEQTSAVDQSVIKTLSASMPTSSRSIRVDSFSTSKEGWGSKTTWGGRRVKASCNHQQQLFTSYATVTHHPHTIYCINSVTKYSLATDTFNSNMHCSNYIAVQCIQCIDPREFV